MLITSRDTKRWVIPKGNPMRGLHPHEAAVEEAFEEAGLRGVIDPTALGAFGYDKRLSDGRLRPTIVDVFPLLVITQAETWPELGERESRWFALDEAAAAVDEPELKALITDFDPRHLPAGRGRYRRIRIMRQRAHALRLVQSIRAFLRKGLRFQTDEQRARDDAGA